MSTHRGLIRNLPKVSASELALRGGTLVRKYRCVYCRRLLNDKFAMPAHEIQCDARLIVQRAWAYAYAKYEREYAALYGPIPALRT